MICGFIFGQKTMPIYRKKKPYHISLHLKQEALAANRASFFGFAVAADFAAAVVADVDVDAVAVVAAASVFAVESAAFPFAVVYAAVTRASNPHYLAVESDMHYSGFDCYSHLKTNFVV